MKLFVPKFDGLQKHVESYKAIVVRSNVKAGQYYMNVNS